MHTYIFGFAIICLNVSLLCGVQVYKFVYLIFGHSKVRGQPPSSLKSNVHAVFEIAFLTRALQFCPGWLVCPGGLPVSDSPELVFYVLHTTTLSSLRVGSGA